MLPPLREKLQARHLRPTLQRRSCRFLEAPRPATATPLEALARRVPARPQAPRRLGSRPRSRLPRNGVQSPRLHSTAPLKPLSPFRATAPRAPTARCAASPGHLRMKAATRETSFSPTSAPCPPPRRPDHAADAPAELPPDATPRQRSRRLRPNWRGGACFSPRWRATVLLAALATAAATATATPPPVSHQWAPLAPQLPRPFLPPRRISSAPQSRRRCQPPPCPIASLTRPPAASSSHLSLCRAHAADQTPVSCAGLGRRRAPSCGTREAARFRQDPLAAEAAGSKQSRRVPAGAAARARGRKHARAAAGPARERE